MTSADDTEKSASLLKKTAAFSAAMEVGPGDDTSSTPEEYFVESCLTFVQQWHRTHDKSKRMALQAPAIFLFKRDEQPEFLLEGAVRQIGFSRALDLAITGAVYACNENCKAVYKLATTAKTGTDAIAYLHDNGIADLTTVLLLPDQEVALVHRCDEDWEEMTRVPFSHDPIGATPFDAKTLDKHLYEFWSKYTKFSTGFCDIWAKVKKRQLKPSAERQIQRSLAGYFHYRIKAHVKIDLEVHTDQGRSDIRLLHCPKPGQGEMAILELKVLKDVSTPPAVAWAIQGVGQLKGYRESEDGPAWKVIACFLCCYDARKVRQHIKSIADAARQAQVFPRRYYMQT